MDLDVMLDDINNQLVAIVQIEEAFRNDPASHGTTNDAYLAKLPIKVGKIYQDSRRDEYTKDMRREILWISKDKNFIVYRSYDLANETLDHVRILALDRFISDTEEAPESPREPYVHTSN